MSELCCRVEEERWEGILVESDRALEALGHLAPGHQLEALAMATAKVLAEDRDEALFDGAHRKLRETISDLLVVQ